MIFVCNIIVTVKHGGNSMSSTKREFKNIGRLVKATRESKGISQTFLSRELGYKNGQFVSNIERGICSIPFEKILTLSTLLGIDPTLIKEAVMKDYSLAIDSYIRKSPVAGDDSTGSTVTVSTVVSR